MGIESIFTNVIHTSGAEKNPDYHPIILKTGMKVAVQRIRSLYQKEKYEHIYVRKEFGEIYGENYPYEISCHLLEDGSKVIVHFMIYNTQGRRKKKEFLRFRALLLTELQDLLEAN